MSFRKYFLTLLILGLTAFSIRPAYAHAIPVQSIPAADARLNIAPAQIEIFFSEAIEPSFSSIKVYDSQGERVDNNDTRLDAADPRHLTVSIRSVPGGVFTVAWNVLSTVDGHITSGAFPFAVGDVDPQALAAAGQASQTYTISPLDILARWLVFLSSASFLGGAVFLVFVWTPAQPGDEVDRSLTRVWRAIRILGLIAFFVGNLLAVMVQAGKAVGAELALPWTPEFADLLITTRGGVLILVRLLLGVALAAALLRRAGLRKWLVVALSLAILVTVSLSSHSAALDAALFPILVDWVHLVGAGIWIGGLMYFAAAMWTLVRGEFAGRTALVARLIPRFSAVALPTVALLGLTGLYSAVVNVASVDKLIGTLYGETLIVKTLFVLPMIGLGAANLLIITGRMRRAAELAASTIPPILRQFRGTVTAEIVLGALILLTVGVLTTLPPSNLSAEPPALQTASQADDLEISLRVTPGRVGINTFVATVSKDGQPLDDAQTVALRFTPSTLNIPPAEVDLQNIGGGQYKVEGSYFSLPDSWQVQAVVRRPDAFDAFANLTFNLGSSVAQSGGFPWAKASGVVLTLMAAGYYVIWQGMARSRRQLVALTSTTCVGFLIAGVVAFAHPEPGPNITLINPIPPNEDSVAAGQALYQRNCVPCHGVSGRGDGPVGLTLNPPPANLTIHTVPGVHPDGQLYLWISDGFPGASAMPAFRTIIADDDRWNLVNYLRTLGTTQ